MAGSVPVLVNAALAVVVIFGAYGMFNFVSDAAHTPGSATASQLRAMYREADRLNARSFPEVREYLEYAEKTGDFDPATFRQLLRRMARNSGSMVLGEKEDRAIALGEAPPPDLAENGTRRRPTRRQEREHSVAPQQYLNTRDDIEPLSEPRHVVDTLQVSAPQVKARHRRCFDASVLSYDHPRLDTGFEVGLEGRKHVQVVSNTVRATMPSCGPMGCMGYQSVLHGPRFHMQAPEMAVLGQVGNSGMFTLDRVVELAAPHVGAGPLALSYNLRRYYGNSALEARADWASLRGETCLEVEEL